MIWIFSKVEAGSFLAQAVVVYMLESIVVKCHSELLDTPSIYLREKDPW